MYCKSCGKEIRDKAVVCVHCGAPTAKASAAANTDAPILETLLCIVFPFFGLLLYAVSKYRDPDNAKIYLYLAAIPIVIAAVLVVVNDMHEYEVVNDIINLIKNFHSIVG